MVIALYFLYAFLLMLVGIVLFLGAVFAVGAWRARGQQEKAATTEDDESISDMQMRAAAALACMQTGKPVVANRDDKGNVTITVVGRNE